MSVKPKLEDAVNLAPSASGSLREANEDLVDVIHVYTLLEEMHRNVGMGLPGYSKEKVLNQIQRCFATGKIFLWEKTGKVVGILALVRGTPWWSNEEYLLDTAFYVSPEA